MMKASTAGQPDTHAAGSAPPLVITPEQPAKPVAYTASIKGPRPLSTKFVDAVQTLEAQLGMPVVMLLQDESSASMDDEVVEGFRKCRATIPQEKIALVIDSPGGSARAAYQLGRMLQLHCSSFVAVVPRFAKSAATLLALGAEEIILGQYGELGPLDVQLTDMEKEEEFSALDAQSLESLHQFGLRTIRETTFMLLMSSRKKMSTVLPMTLHYVADLMRPLLEKVDIVHYTRTSRNLRIAEEYARRLMATAYGKDHAKEIVAKLVTQYPDHGFVIDFPEAESLSLKVRAMSAEQNATVDNLLEFLGRIDVVGRLQVAP